MLFELALNKKLISTYPHSVLYQWMFQNIPILNISFHLILGVPLSLALHINNSILTCWSTTYKHLWTLTSKILCHQCKDYINFKASWWIKGVLFQCRWYWACLKKFSNIFCLKNIYTYICKCIYNDFYLYNKYVLSTYCISGSNQGIKNNNK